MGLLLRPDPVLGLGLDLGLLVGLADCVAQEEGSHQEPREEEIENWVESHQVEGMAGHEEDLVEGLHWEGTEEKGHLDRQEEGPYRDLVEEHQADRRVVGACLEINGQHQWKGWGRGHLTWKSRK